MTDRLYKWLETRWKYDNHKKYQKYFEEWISNITDSQIRGFSKMMKKDNIYE